jgi:hypothetical protein
VHLICKYFSFLQTAKHRLISPLGHKCSCCYHRHCCLLDCFANGVAERPPSPLRPQEAELTIALFFYSYSFAGLTTIIATASAAVSVVASKSFHLRTVSKYAERFSCSVSVNEGRKARAALMTNFLTGSCAAEKYEARRGTARMRCKERRRASGNLLVGNDFRRFGKAAGQRLNSVIQSGPDTLRPSRSLLSG